MAISLQDVQELRQQIEADRKKLEEREAALRVLESMLAESERKSHGDTDRPKVVSASVLAPSRSGKKSFPKQVAEIVDQFGHQEFTSSDIYEVLEQQGRVPPGKTPKARIANALSLLEKDGIVEITRKGSGRQPFRYRLKRIRLVQGNSKED